MMGPRMRRPARRVRGIASNTPPNTSSTFTKVR
jgi:hypothetical protein